MNIFKRNLNSYSIFQNFLPTETTNKILHLIPLNFHLSNPKSEKRFWGIEFSTIASLLVEI